MMFLNNTVPKDKTGFTLVELMISIVLAGIIIVALYSAYNAQNKTYSTQGQVVEMQQNLRAAMEHMTMEMRIAAYDLTGKAGASIDTATASQFAFTADLDDDGVIDDGGTPSVTDTNEEVTFCLAVTGGDDADGDGCDDDGIVDAAVNGASILRNGEIIADKIKELEFCYFPRGSNQCQLTVSTAEERSNIETVRISLFATSTIRDPKYTDNNIYKTHSKSGDKEWKYQDNFRHRFLTSRVNIRNQ